MTEKTQLTQSEILYIITKKLKKYRKLDYYQQFALYMGNVQLLEIALKNLLGHKYGQEESTMEKWTLGKITSELQNQKLRNDFVSLLKTVVERRNYVAHELLVNEIIYSSLLTGLKLRRYYNKELRFLHKGIIELEQALFLFNWIDQKNAWDNPG